jgi:hypothetical protein
VIVANLCPAKFLKKLIGKKEMEDALKRLDKLTQDEARMAAAEILKLTHIVMNGMSSESATGTPILNAYALLDGKETKQAVQQLTNSMDDAKCSSSLCLFLFAVSLMF